MVATLFAKSIERRAQKRSAEWMQGWHAGNNGDCEANCPFHPLDEKIAFGEWMDGWLTQSFGMLP